MGAVEVLPGPDCDSCLSPALLFLWGVVAVVVMFCSHPCAFVPAPWAIPGRVASVGVSPVSPVPSQSVYEPYGVQFVALPKSTDFPDDDLYGENAPGFLLFSDNQGLGVRAVAHMCGASC